VAGRGDCVGAVDGAVDAVGIDGDGNTCGLDVAAGRDDGDGVDDADDVDAVDDAAIPLSDAGLVSRDFFAIPLLCSAAGGAFPAVAFLLIRSCRARSISARLSWSKSNGVGASTTGAGLLVDVPGLDFCPGLSTNERAIAFFKSSSSLLLLLMLPLMVSSKVPILGP